MKDPVFVLFISIVSVIIITGLFAENKSSIFKENESELKALKDIEEIEAKLKKEKLEKLKEKHISVPENGVKALYLTSYIAGNKSARDKIVGIIEKTELNSVIIDIKEVDGYVNYKIGNESSFPYQKNLMPDIEDFINELHQKDIYVIGRLVLFKDKVWVENNIEHAVLRKDDPSRAWADYGGKKFVDPGATEFWDYLYKIAAKSYEIGFDEINFDYIRYPSDGQMENTYYQHSDENLRTLGPEKGRVTTLTNFMSHITGKLRDEYPDIKLSADVFGMVTTNSDDLTIGQKLEPFLANFDYVSPMVYPSHYPPFFLGLTPHPDLYPYEVVFHSEKKAQDRLDRLNLLNDQIKSLESLNENSTSTLSQINSYKNELKQRTYMKDVDNLKFGLLRPWIQDFTCTWCSSHVYYGQEQIQAQINATNDAGQAGWMVWNPSNSYILSDFVK